MNNLVEKSRTEANFDAIVIGAGFGGIYMLHKLRNELALKVRAFEKGGGIGGTWYFNRYPGAKSDTEGFAVSCSNRHQQYICSRERVIYYPDLQYFRKRW